MNHQNYTPGQKMYHHDARDYETAAAAAAATARTKLDAMIETGRREAAAAVESLMNEASRRNDYLIPTDDLRFGVLDPDADSGPGTMFAYAPGVQEMKVTKHARLQVADRLRVPNRFLENLLEEPKGREVLRGLLNDLNYRWAGDRVLVREVDDVARAVLTDSYCPIDQSELVTTFVKTCEETGAYPTKGSFVTDSKYGLRAILPELFEPIPGEPLVLGLQMSCSEYGDGSMEVRMLATRMWCTNTAIGESLVRKIHLGGGQLKALTPGLIEWSPETLSLNSRAAVSGMKDAMHSVFSPKRREAISEGFRRMAAETVNPESAGKELIRKGVLRRADLEGLVAMVKGDNRIEVLPRTENPESKLRFAQALSWLAQSKPAEERVALETEAGRLMAV